MYWCAEVCAHAFKGRARVGMGCVLRTISNPLNSRMSVISPLPLPASPLKGEERCVHTLVALNPLAIMACSDLPCRSSGPQRCPLVVALLAMGLSVEETLTDCSGRWPNFDYRSDVTHRLL